MKNTILSFIACSAILGFSAETTYTQNNASKQNQQAGFSRNYPIILNGDVLYGKIHTTALSLAQTLSTNQSVTDILKDRPSFGFRVGAGVGLKNHFNISAQYSLLKNTQNPYTKTLTYDTLGFFLKELAFIAPSFTVTQGQEVKWQQFDVIVQTAAWMLSSNVRFQPFGGLRFVEYIHNFQGNVEGIFVPVFGFPLPATSSVTSQEKLRALGAFIGTDIKYMIRNSLHFFSSITAGILAGRYDSKRHFTFVIPQLFNSENTSDLRHESNWLPLLDMSFGLAKEMLLKNHYLLSFRIAYGLNALFHASNPPVNIVNSNNLQNASFCVQMGSLGMTVAF